MIEFPLRTGDTPYICLHEAGHIFATYLSGGYVNIAELINHPGRDAYGRTNSQFNPADRKRIACAGFAVELILYRSAKIIADSGLPISERSFIDASLSNARVDKESFFDGNFEEEDGCWPEEMDWEFMNYAIDNLVPSLHGNFQGVEMLAAKLAKDSPLDRLEIERIVFAKS